MYKLIAIDLDGTLLNSYGEISEENKEAIRYATNKNVHVVLTSGRVTKSIKNFALDVGADKYLISGNGSLIYDIQEDKIIYDKFLTKEQVLKIANICEKNSIYYSISTQNGIIAKSLNYNILFYNNENTNKLEEKKTSINIIPNLYNYLENTELKEFLKISICDKDKIIFSSIINKLRNIKNIDVLDVGHISRKIIKTGTEDTQIDYFYTEITNKNTDKWEAIKNLIEKLNIKQEEVMAIGDNVNDKTMIENAGMGVFVENTDPNLKHLAKLIVSDNNSNGVSEAIRKMI